MIPILRGKSYTINECLYGDEETEKTPVVGFASKLAEFPQLLETALGIEGLVCGRGIHASGTLVFNQNYIEQVSLMKAPNGTDITCWSMEDSDIAGALKFDLLTVECLDRIHKCMNFLEQDGKITWQNSLRETYNKYLHPDVLDYTSPSMWKKLADNEVTDLFQFYGGIGADCARKVKPSSLREMALANSLMRLSAYQGEMPMDKYIRFKQEPRLWDIEMDSYKLNQEEKKTLKKYLDETHGIAAEQEDVMMLSMDKNISNFDVKTSNLLRKSISKKKKKLLDEAKELFFKEGEKIGTRKNFLEYVWQYCIMPQAGYSFSKLHTMPYSAIGLQEMNLVEKYGSLYWNAACLTISAMADEETESSGSTNYGKIAGAISHMQQRKVTVTVPEINSADFGFRPNSLEDNIIFGLKGINGIGDDVARAIVANRPYANLTNFYNCHRKNIATKQYINLVKAGCFDVIEPNKTRKETMQALIRMLVLEQNTPIIILNTSHYPQLFESGIMEMSEFPMIPKYYNWYKYINQTVFRRGTNEVATKKNVVWLDEKATRFFKDNVQSKMKEGKDFFVKEGEYHVFTNASKKWLDAEIAPFKTRIHSRQTYITNEFNKMRFNQFGQELWDKYCQGTQSQWEMESLSFYYGEHELHAVDMIKYNLSNFNMISPEPVISSTYTSKRGTHYQYQLHKIVGTVLDRNKTKHYITLLTPSGVVTVKIYRDLFIDYDKQISKRNADGTKTIVDKSWFSRGTKLQIMGFRRDDQFIPRKYNSVIYKHIFAKITNIDCWGNYDLITERPKGAIEDAEEDD